MLSGATMHSDEAAWICRVEHLLTLHRSIPRLESRREETQGIRDPGLLSV
jgi:hypothetical protein